MSSIGNLSVEYCYVIGAWVLRSQLSGISGEERRAGLLEFAKNWLRVSHAVFEKILFVALNRVSLVCEASQVFKLCFSSSLLN